MQQISGGRENFFKVGKMQKNGGKFSAQCLTNDLVLKAQSKYLKVMLGLHFWVVTLILKFHFVAYYLVLSFNIREKKVRLFCSIFIPAAICRRGFSDE